MHRWLGWVAAAGLFVAGPAVAQKYTGSAIPVTPPVSKPVRPKAAAPPPPAPAPLDADAERLARSLPLDPATRDLQDRLPADVPGVERQLGLRPPKGPVTDLRGQVPTPPQIVDALAPR
jgi:hypothetical protein